MHLMFDVSHLLLQRRDAARLAHAWRDRNKFSNSLKIASKLSNQFCGTILIDTDLRHGLPGIRREQPFIPEEVRVVTSTKVTVYFGDQGTHPKERVLTIHQTANLTYSIPNQN